MGLFAVNSKYAGREEVNVDVRSRPRSPRIRGEDVLDKRREAALGRGVFDGWEYGENEKEPKGDDLSLR